MPTRSTVVDDASRPAVPHNLVGIAGEDSIALSWEQLGEADQWTVYVDPLDGTETAVYRTNHPRFEVTDLPRGDHEIGVMAWREGIPCPGPGVFLMVSVLGISADTPRHLDAPILAATATSVEAQWEHREATRWDARLVAADFTVEQRIEGLPSPRVSFTQLRPDTLYGLQVRYHTRNGATSSWSTTAWQRTRKNACGRLGNQNAASSLPPNDQHSKG